MFWSRCDNNANKFSWWINFVRLFSFYQFAQVYGIFANLFDTHKKNRLLMSRWSLDDSEINFMTLSVRIILASKWNQIEKGKWKMEKDFRLDICESFWMSCHWMNHQTEMIQLFFCKQSRQRMWITRSISMVLVLLIWVYINKSVNRNSQGLTKFI